jgi:GDP-L-fucose synthase
MAGPILLFGGTGMVGRNVLDLAAARNVEIVAPSRSEVDLADGNAIADCMRRVAPDTVIHAAGRVGGIEANIREPVAFLTENWEMGRNVVIGARNAGVRQLINLGSSCMFPKDSERPLTEGDILSGPLEPTNEAYAIAKSAVQRLAAYVSTEDSRFRFKTLIPCNLYGRYDAFDPSRSHLAAAAIVKLHKAKIEGASTVEIWGDGSARREFLYAGDLAHAILAAVERFDSLPPVMNVGAGHDLTVDEYYRAAAEVVGFTGTFVHDLSRPVGMQRKLMDVGLAREWGWKALTSLRDGLAATYDYYCSLMPAAGEPASAISSDS